MGDQAAQCRNLPTCSRPATVCGDLSLPSGTCHHLWGSALHYGEHDPLYKPDSQWWQTCHPLCEPAGQTWGPATFLHAEHPVLPHAKSTGAAPGLCPLGKCHMLGDIMAPRVGVLAVGLALDTAARTNLVLHRLSLKLPWNWLGNGDGRFLGVQHRPPAPASPSSPGRMCRAAPCAVTFSVSRSGCRGTWAAACSKQSRARARLGSAAVILALEWMWAGEAAPTFIAPTAGSTPAHTSFMQQVIQERG